MRYLWLTKVAGFMEKVFVFTGFVILFIAITVLLVYVVVSKRNKAVQLYQAASREESRGNYTEAIALYEKYLRETGGDGQQVVYKIKTLRAFTRNE